MPPFNGSFNANQHAPKQVGESHPVGKFPFQVQHTECVQTKDQKGGMFVVTFKTPSGEIPLRYNLWNESAKAVEIAHGQLSALCHATGVFKLDWNNEGAALRGARGMIEVGYQKGQEPTQDNPNGGYTEIKKVYDANGNEPGKGPAPAPQPQEGNWGGQQQQPMQQQSNGGWVTPQTQQPSNPQPQQQPSGWPQPGQQQQPQDSTPPWRR